MKMIYKLQPGIQIVYSITNDDVVEYSVCRKNNMNNSKNEFEIFLYVCTKDGPEIAFFNFDQQPKSEMPKQFFIVAENNLFNNRNYF